MATGLQDQIVPERGIETPRDATRHSPTRELWVDQGRGLVLDSGSLTIANPITVFHGYILEYHHLDSEIPYL